MSFTVTSGRRIYLQPFEFSQLALQGVWDQGPLLADVRRGHFRAVVLRFRLEEDPSWRGADQSGPAGALREHHELDAEFGDYFIYRYRAPPHPLEKRFPGGCAEPLGCASQGPLARPRAPFWEGPDRQPGAMVA